MIIGACGRPLRASDLLRVERTCGKFSTAYTRKPGAARDRRPREKLWGGRQGNGNFVAACNRWSAAMPQPNDLSRSLVTLDENSTIIAVIETSQSSWLVAGVLPGIERQPRKNLEPNAEGLLDLLIAGAMRRSGPVKRSRGLRLPSKPAATAFGWRAAATSPRRRCFKPRGNGSARQEQTTCIHPWL